MTIIGQHKATIRNISLDFCDFSVGAVGSHFLDFWLKSRVPGQIGRSGKVLGFISSKLGPNPTAGRPPKGNNRGAILIIIIPDGNSRYYFSDLFLEHFGAKQLGSVA